MRGLGPSDPRCIHTVEELKLKIEDWGFLPFFAGEIPGFSVEEMTDPSAWWTGDPGSDPWEWRQRIAGEGKIAYGKFFNKKAGFISKKWFPCFANYRRDGYDFDARWDDELASYRQKKIMSLFMDMDGQSGPPGFSAEGQADRTSEDPTEDWTNSSYDRKERPSEERKEDRELMTADIRQLAGFGKGGEKNFEGTLTGLEMLTYLICCDFRRKKNKKGEYYGWYNAIYSTPEHVFGQDFVTSEYSDSPKESMKKIVGRVQKLFPEATESQILRTVGCAGDIPGKQRNDYPYPLNVFHAIDKKRDPYTWTQDQISGLFVAMGQLNTKQQRVLYMKYFEGMKNDEIGAEMNRAAGTIGSYHGAAMKRLRSHLVAAWYLQGYRENLKACAAGRCWGYPESHPGDIICADDYCLRIGIKVTVFEKIAGCGLLTAGDLADAMRKPDWFREIYGVGPKTAEDLENKMRYFHLLG